MASAIRGVWAIDIGGNSLKALRLRAGPEGYEVIGFDYVEHSKILSSGEVEEEEKDKIIRASLRTFLERSDIGDDEVAISVAGHSSFARFIKLPPVEMKEIPKIVQYEAVQQIPFDINEVEWDWQIMENPDSPDTEVGIFAIKNELINSIMDHFTNENLKVACVQIAPMALYNFIAHDRDDLGGPNEKATIILDMGAENTTLVVCTSTSVWQRTIRIGGNTFTEAIAQAFKLDFRKAEKLKRTAPMSKYMRQIFTAMKPVYTDLGSEIQRSLGFYSTSGTGRDKGFSKVIALGGGMKLQGIAKYLQQTLSLPVAKPESFEKLSIGSQVSSAKFHKNISDFGVVYGLAVQLLGGARIASNLLPRRIARAMSWTRKAKSLTIAASLLLAVSVIGLANAIQTRAKYNSDNSLRARRTIKGAINSASQAQQSLEEESSKDPVLANKIIKQVTLFKYRHVVPLVHQTLLSCLPNAQNNPDQGELYNAFDRSDVTTVISYPRQERKQLFVTSMSVDYVDSLAEAKFGAIRKKSRSSSGIGISMGEDYGGDDMMMGMDSGPVADFLPPGVSRREERSEQGESEQLTDGAGFLVVIEGYSPYKDMEKELLDPARVGDEMGRWGLVTRFKNLAKVTGQNNFKLFGKDDIEHFKLETGEVELNSSEMPDGIGLEKQIERIPQEQGRIGEGTSRESTRSGGQDYVTVEKVLIDPMTMEEMSKTFDLVTQDQIDSNPSLSDRDLGKKKYTQFDKVEYIVKDHWFRISAKFLWKDAPKPESPAGGEY